MHITKIELQHFRSYENFFFTFDEAPLTIISGENGQGKTNLLEALYALALTKSFRNTKTKDLIQWGQDFFRIKAVIRQTSQHGQKGEQLQDKKIEDHETLEICATESPSRKIAFKKNEVIIPRKNFLGNLRVVLFRPEDLEMLTGAPSLRRKYLNNILIQTFPDFLETLQKYQHALTQRNALLQQKAHTQVFEPWDQKLIEHGEKIRNARRKLIDFMANRLQKPYQIEYCTSKKPLIQGLSEHFHRDQESGYTSIGPHRDDVNFTYNTHPLALAASRGELRQLMIQLKKAEIDWHTGNIVEASNISSSTKTSQPILLLDDIFSELDSFGKAECLKLLPDCQTIITVAEGNTLPPLKGEATVRKLSSQK